MGDKEWQKADLQVSSRDLNLPATRLRLTHSHHCDSSLGHPPRNPPRQG